MLAQKISRILQEGFTLTEEILHFIEATVASPSPEVLKSIFSEAAGGDPETLVSLIFFPDAAVQMQLEDVLEAAGFEPGDADRVILHLRGQLPETPLRFPDGAEAVRVRMPRWAADPFVARLRIEKRLDAGLAAAVDDHVTGDRRTRVRVMLRNSRFAETENRIAFLRSFFETVADAEGAGLGFVLALFEERPDHPDIYEALIDRKRHCFKSLQTGRKYQQMLQTDNMETLMLRGVRIPHVDQEDMKAKMKLIDRICLAVYGKTEYFRPPEQVLGVEDYPLE